MPDVYLSLGTNIGDRSGNLRTALDRLSRIVTIAGISSVYRSEPVGYRTQPDFWNLVVHVETALEPVALLDGVKGIERDMGRRLSFRNAPRVIDIDILVYGHARVRTERLRLPHPRMLKRGFVLRPLAEIAPDLPHPTTQRRIREHLAEAGPDLEYTERLFPGETFLDVSQGGS